MRIKLFLPFAVTGLLVSSCVMEDLPVPERSICAEIDLEGDTKTSVTDEGFFTWSAGDKVWLHTTGGGITGTLSSGAGTASANFSYGAHFGEMTGKAVYPYNSGHSISGDVLTVNLPATYELGSVRDNTNALMYGVSQNNTLKFNHMAGVMRFNLKNVPAGANQFKITLDKKINGEFTADLSETHPSVTTEGTSNDSEKTITLNFDALTQTADLRLCFPLPVGTYNSLALELNSETTTIWSYSKNVSNTVNRKGLLLMPAVNIGGSVSGDIENGEVASNVIDLSAEGTANSYIVSQAGTYSFSSVKGNTLEPVGSVASVEVLWETFGTSETPALGSLIASVSYEDDMIKFSTPQTYREGNASIAAKDANGTILWSWHIWMTDQPEEHIYPNNAGTMMDRNLGATSATPGDLGALGLLYQWGRKDPFPGASVTYYDDTYTTGCEKAATTCEWKSVLTLTSTGTIDYTIKNPTTFIRGDSYTSQDWLYTSTTTKRWDSVKTKYDPCPSGWRVPDGGSSGSNGLWAVAGFENSTFSSTNYGVEFELPSSATCWYPAAGMLSHYNSLLRVYASGVVGYYWSATVDPYDAYTMEFSDASITAVSEQDRAYALPVRCYKEGTAGAPIVPSPGVPEEGDYVDANGVNHGQGVNIDGVVWAPVNVGATSAEKYGTYYGWNAAHNACPEGWRLPYDSELESLTANNQVATYNGVNGRWMSGSISSTNPSFAIFLPAAGDERGGLQREYCGYYWSATGDRYRNKAHALGFTTSTDPHIQYEFSVSQNIPVRCVLIQTSEAANSERTIDGLTWATRNVGAQTYSEIGNYYLSSTASIICPDGWRVPTTDDFDALKQNYSELTTENGVQGRWFSGSNHNANSSTGIFLPLGGYQYLDSDDGTRYSMTAAYYWSNSDISALLYYDSNAVALRRLNNSAAATPVRCVKGTYTGPAIEGPDENATEVVVDGLTWSTKNVGAESISDYGDTFTRDEALNACPSGWRLPSKDEMNLLLQSYSWDNVAGQYGISYSNQTTGQTTLFLPTVNDAYYGYYWTSTEYSSAYQYSLSVNSNVTIDYNGISNEYAVRCVKGQVDLGLGRTEGASYTITLEPSGAEYGWQTSTTDSPNAFLYDGLYQSANRGQDDTEAVMYIDIVGYETFTLYIRNNGESGYDYMMVSQLDKTINGDTSYTDTSLVKAYDRSNNGGTTLSSYTEVKYTGIDRNSHRITVVYRKDGSEREGTDRGYVMIPIYQ